MHASALSLNLSSLTVNCDGVGSPAQPLSSSTASSNLSPVTPTSPFTAGMASHFHFGATDAGDAEMSLHTAVCDPPSRIYLGPPSTSPAASGSRPSTSSSHGYPVKHSSSDTEVDSTYEDGSSLTLITATEDSFHGSASGTRTPPDMDLSHGGDDGVNGGLGIPSGMVGTSAMTTSRPGGSNNFVSKLYQYVPFIPSTSPLY